MSRDEKRILEERIAHGRIMDKYAIMEAAEGAIATFTRPMKRRLSRKRSHQPVKLVLPLQKESAFHLIGLGYTLVSVL